MKKSLDYGKNKQNGNIAAETLKSKEMNWKIVGGDMEKSYQDPAIEAYYLLERWKKQGKKDFLDLGCGLGRHAILFAKNGFSVSAFDISSDAISKTRSWAVKEKLKLDYQVGDMMNLPYEDESQDCIYCRGVITHTDTAGIKEAITQLHRVLRKDGECYVTLCSKDSDEWKYDWKQIDENTKLKEEVGPEYGIPHFFADYNLIFTLFRDFRIQSVQQVVDYYDSDDGQHEVCFHYHVLIRK